MHPDLIAGLPIKTYGFCMALGFLAAWQVLSWLCRRTGRSPEPLSNLLMLMMFSGIIGARLEYVREFWDREFAANPLAIVKVWQGGLVFYGGLILAIAVFFVWCRVRRERMAPVADLGVHDFALTILRNPSSAALARERARLGNPLRFSETTPPSQCL